jgi:predicted enzyme related to lactoylglutathione lyase
MASKLALIEFPADDAERALGFWSGLLGVALQPRDSAQGEGWQSAAAAGEPAPAVGVHQRGRGPGDSFSLPYFEVDDIEQMLARVLRSAAASSIRASDGRSARTPRAIRSASRSA